MNPQRPSPVTARHVIGQMLPDLMFGCLEQALKGLVPAESAGSIWVLAMSRDRSIGKPFNVMSVGLGGAGARPIKDGLSTTAFPSGVGAIPIEVTEVQAPLVFWHKEYLPDSGGAGQWRGGLAQRIIVGAADQQAFECSAATFDRRDNPARGRAGGAPGARGSVTIQKSNGEQIRFEGKASIHVPAGAKMQVDLPGGGGFGFVKNRSTHLINKDKENGWVTVDCDELP